jgi:hypothetical protein
MKDGIFYLDGDDRGWRNAEANGAMTHTVNEPSEPAVTDDTQ